MLTTFETGDPRRTLDDEYRDRGLIRPNQLKKFSKEDRKNFELVEFPWGKYNVRGYRR